MKKLIIFTKLFPYAKTESFLESEVSVLANFFDEIVICPAYNDKFIRELPNNVLLNNDFLISKKDRTKSLCKSLLKGKIVKYVFDHITNIKKINDIGNLIRYAGYEYLYSEMYKKSNLFFDEKTIIYSYWFGHFVNSLIQVKLKQELNFKIITRAHRWDIYEEEGMLFPYRKSNLLNLNGLFSISQDGKKYLKEKYKTNLNISISRLGVHDKGVISKKSVNKEEQISIVSVSQIIKRKRVILLCKTIAQLAKNNPELNIYWTHFGTGPLQKDLEELIKTYKYKNLKIVLKGYVVNKQIYQFYTNEQVDMFVNLSESEGVPVSIMEAQSFGIPVIATDVGGTSEIVNNKVGVLLNKNPDVQLILDSIYELYKKDLDRKTIKMQWNKISNAKINYENFAKALLKI